MALSYKARRRWSLVVLLVGLPLYIVLAMVILGLISDHVGRPPILIELAVYIGLGIIWILPFRRIFTGIGKADPDSRTEDRNG